MSKPSGYRIIARIACRNLLRSKRRSIMTLVIVAIGISSCCVLAALARGLTEQMIKNAIYTLTGHIQIHAPAYRDDPTIENSLSALSQSERQRLKLDNVKHWSARIKTPGVVMSERESAGIHLVGIDPSQEVGFSIAGQTVTIGRNLKDSKDTGIVVGNALLETLQTAVGKRVVIMTRDRSGVIADRGFRVIGAYEAELKSTEKSYIFAGIGTVQQMLGAEQLISEVALTVHHQSVLADTRSQLRKIFPEADIHTWPELEPLLEAMTTIQGGFLIIWFGVVMICVSFGIVNTIFMSVFERTRELGVMQALGMKPLSILLQIVFESLLLIVLGTVAGLGVGVWGVHALSNGVDISQFARGAEQAGIGSTVFPVIFLQDITCITLLMIFIGTFGSLYPAYFAARQIPARQIGRN